VIPDIQAFAWLAHKPTYAPSARWSDDGKRLHSKRHSLDQVQSFTKYTQTAVVGWKRIARLAPSRNSRL